MHTNIIFSILLQGMDPGDSTTYEDASSSSPVRTEGDPDVSELTVGLPAEYHCRGMSEEVLQAWSDVADMLENNGVRVKQVRSTSS